MYELLARKLNPAQQILILFIVMEYIYIYVYIRMYVCMS